MTYDHVIAYALLALVVVDIEAIISYLAARKLWHANRHFDVMRCAVYAVGCAILYFIIPYLEFLVFIVFSLYHAVGSSDIPHACYTSNSCCSIFLTSSEGDSYY